MVSFQAGEVGGPQPAARLGQAVFVGLVSMVLHGLADDAFYGEYGTPFLFVLPAAAAAAARLAQQDRPLLPSGNANRAPRRSIRWIGGAALIVLAAISIFGRSLFSLALANLGAVRMARVQLADFPAGAWDEKLTSNALDQAEDLLQQSLAWNPRNRSANQRLGLIAMLRWDFQAACPFLQKAYQADPGHRGVVKNLGYCLAWTAQYGEALPYLARIPEARQELSAYAGWWLARGHSDLAENARRMRTLLTDEVKP
jgi:tetratricopeptide (TPR) repeat protein